MGYKYDHKYDYEFDLNGAVHLGCILYVGVSLEQYRAAMATIRPHINPPEPTPEERREINKAQEARAEKGFFRDAEKLSEWDGWVYWDRPTSNLEDYSDEGCRDGYWHSVDDLLQAIQAHNGACEETDTEEDCIDIPAYVWCCCECRLGHSDVSDLFAERLEESTYEDAWDSVPETAIAALQTALAAFYAETDKVVAYRPNYKKALILDTNYAS